MNSQSYLCLWNWGMIIAIFLMCIFGARGVDRDIKLRKNRPQVVKINRKAKKFLFLRAKDTRSRFPVLAVILNFYGWIQAVILSVLNIIVYCCCPEYLKSLGNIISTVQIGVVSLITLLGCAIIWIQNYID